MPDEQGWVTAEEIEKLLFTLTDEQKGLVELLLDELTEAYFESVNEMCSEPDADGWFSTMARSTACGLCDRLKQFGELEEDAGRGHGRVRWFRLTPGPEGKRGGP